MAPKQILGTDVQPAGMISVHWECVAHVSHTMEDVLHPRYLWNAKDKLHPRSFVTIHHPNADFIVVLYVVEIDEEARCVRCKVWDKRDMRDQAVPALDLNDAKVEWKGPSAKFSIVRGTDRLKDGFSTREEAEAWLEEKRAA